MATKLIDGKQLALYSVVVCLRTVQSRTHCRPVKPMKLGNKSCNMYRLEAMGTVLCLRTVRTADKTSLSASKTNEPGE